MFSHSRILNFLANLFSRTALLECLIHTKNFFPRLLVNSESDILGVETSLIKGLNGNENETAKRKRK